MTTTTTAVSIWMPFAPGHDPVCVGTYATLAEARTAAKDMTARRGDLRHQDVEIRLGRDGKRIEFAGPAR